ncbi:uracil-DNA glycosylase family protein [Draconibacterium halophilum]
MGSTGCFIIECYINCSCTSGRFAPKKGWEQFTDAVIKKISEEKENVVFLLWGNYAISKSKFIDQDKHFVLTSVHPSPLSASRGFFGNKHFSRTNEFLVSKGLEPINW